MAYLHLPAGENRQQQYRDTTDNNQYTYQPCSRYNEDQYQPYHKSYHQADEQAKLMRQLLCTIM